MGLFLKRLWIIIKAMWDPISIPLVPIMAALAIYIWQVNDFRAWVASLLVLIAKNGPHARYGVFGFLILFCILIYGFRSNQRHVYGLFETAFGLACIWEGLDPQRDPKTAGAIVIAGVYVVMRGIDNTRKGWQEQEEARIERRKNRAPLPATEQAQSGPTEPNG